MGVTKPTILKLREIIKRHPVEMQKLVSNLGIKATPTPSALVLAFAYNPDLFLEVMENIRSTEYFDNSTLIEPYSKVFGDPITNDTPTVDPGAYSVGYDGKEGNHIKPGNWWQQRKIARYGNRLTSSKLIGGKAVKTGFQLPSTYNPLEGVFRANEYFKVPISFNPYPKGYISTNPKITNSCTLKNTKGQEIKITKIKEELIPPTEILKNNMNQTITELKDTALGDTIRKTESMKRVAKVANTDDTKPQISLPAKKEQSTIKDDWALFAAISVIGLVLCFFLATRIK